MGSRRTIRKQREHSDELSSPSVPKVVMFDLDGTLVDTMQTFAGVASRILESYAGIPSQRGRSLYLETSGIPFSEQLKLIVPDHPDTKMMSAMFEVEKIAAVSDVLMSTSTRRALQTLRSSGISFGISSNNYQHNVLAFAARADMTFDFALGCTSTMRKGRPHVDYVTRYCGCRPSDIVFVGDSHSDAAMAIECGIRFVAVLTTFTRQSFREICFDVHCIDEVSFLPDLFGLTEAHSHSAEGVVI